MPVIPSFIRFTLVSANFPRIFQGVQFVDCRESDTAKLVEASQVLGRSLSEARLLNKDILTSRVPQHLRLACLETEKGRRGSNRPLQNHDRKKKQNRPRRPGAVRHLP